MPIHVIELKSTFHYVGGIPSSAGYKHIAGLGSVLAFEVEGLEI